MKFKRLLEYISTGDLGNNVPMSLYGGDNSDPNFSPIDPSAYADEVNPAVPLYNTTTNKKVRKNAKKI